MTPLPDIPRFADNPCVNKLKRWKIMISYGKLVLICSVLLLINFVVVLNRWITNPYSAHRCEMTTSFLVRVWQVHGRAMPIWFSIQINYILVLLHNIWFNSYLASLVQMAERLEWKSMSVRVVHLLSAFEPVYDLCERHTFVKLKKHSNRVIDW